MRNLILLSTVGASLAACGGAGPQSAGSAAAVVTPTTSVSTGQQHSFVAPVDAKTYEALGAAQHYEYYTRSDRSPSGQYGQLYAGDANTARDSGISVAYDPRDAIFQVTVSRSKAIVDTGVNRFQDPVHRTDFGGQREPQSGVPKLDAARQIQYLQSGTSSGDATAAAGQYPQGKLGYSAQSQTFFYQKPGTTTKYVTYGGYVRNQYGVSQVTTNTGTSQATASSYLRSDYNFDRALMAWGERTDNNAVPKVGSGTYTGEMLASMVYNTLLDTDVSSPTYFQWIQGSHSTSVDFATLGVTSTLTGTVLAPTVDAGSNGQFAIPAGTTFSASAKASIDLVGKGGFTGQFTAAGFTNPGQATTALTIAGSSFDGVFFGPAAEEMGAGFRIVGGKPDERIDILGVMTGKK